LKTVQLVGAFSVPSSSFLILLARVCFASLRLGVMPFAVPAICSRIARRVSALKTVQLVGAFSIPSFSFLILPARVCFASLRLGVMLFAVPAICSRMIARRISALSAPLCVERNLGLRTPSII
jgi:hypothetical protein